MAQQDASTPKRTSRVRDPEQDGLLHVDAEPFLRGSLRTVVEVGGWFRPWRFAEAQERSLTSVDAWHPGLYRQMARCTAGICLAFETDAQTIALELHMDPEPPATADQLELVDGVDGPRLPHDGVSATVDGKHLPARLPQGTMERVVFDLGPLPDDGVHRVRVWLPWGRGCALRDVLANGSFVRGLPARPGLLVISDSIAQGFCVDDPAFAWPTLVGEALGLDVVNQGVGGQIFQASSLAGLAALERPVAVLVALGQNYAFAPFGESVVRRDAKLFFRALAQAFPGVPVLVATPTWRGPGARLHARSSFARVPELLREVVATHEGMAVVDGLSLLPHDVVLLADGEDHPNQEGARLMAQAWVEELLRVIVPPADATRLVEGVVRADEGYGLGDVESSAATAVVVPEDEAGTVDESTCEAETDRGTASEAAPERPADPEPDGPKPGADSPVAAPRAADVEAPAPAEAAGSEPEAPVASDGAGSLFTVVSARPEPADAIDDAVAATGAAPCSGLAAQLAERKAAASSQMDSPEERAVQAKTCAAHRAELISRFYAGGSLEKSAPKSKARRATRTAKSPRESSVSRKRKARVKSEKLEPQLEPAPPRTRQLTLFDAIEGGAGDERMESKPAPGVSGQHARPADDTPGLTLVSGPAREGRADASGETRGASDDLPEE